MLDKLKFDIWNDFRGLTAIIYSKRVQRASQFEGQTRLSLEIEVTAAVRQFSEM
jgi:hypothetical protein